MPSRLLFTGRASVQTFSREPRSFEGCELFVQARLFHMHLAIPLMLRAVHLLCLSAPRPFTTFPRRQKFAAQVLAVLALKLCKRYPFVSVAICLCY